MVSSKSVSFIDSHSHLDATRLNTKRETLLQEARALGLVDILLCAGQLEDFTHTKVVAKENRLHYALGIHPLFLRDQKTDTLLTTLRKEIEVALTDPLFAAVGEIGLEGLVPPIPLPAQYDFFIEELKIARDFHLPVSLHARHAVDIVIKALRQIKVSGGAVHAFNGSLDQAKKLVDLGFKLGFGGAMTYEGSKNIRRIAQAIDASSYVLETDTPDMPGTVAKENERLESCPADTLAYARTLAELRGESLKSVLNQSVKNTFEAFPRMTRFE